MINADKWLYKNAAWNAKRTVAKTNIFAVPISLLVGTDDLIAENTASSDKLKQSTIFTAASASETAGLTCIGCKLQFSNLNEQHLHFKSDFHRVNLRRNLRGQTAFTLAEYERSAGASVETGEGGIVADAVAVDGGEDGSDSEASSGGSDGEEQEQEQLSGADLVPHSSARGTVTKQFSKGHGPVFVFRRAPSQVDEGAASPPATADSSGWEFTISQAAFHSQSPLAQKSWQLAGDPWRALRAQLDTTRSNPLSCVFLLRSGRFAGAIFEGERLVVHKVLRRYTVRAKAGGAQSSHDTKSGKAKSAGAMLRRYGEQALKEDIQALLRLWSSHLQCCEFIYMSAPRTMRSVFFDRGGVAGSSNRESSADFLAPDDPRVCFVPFMVDRPTLDEAKFVHARCTNVIFSRVKEGAVADSTEQLDLLRSDMDGITIEQQAAQNEKAVTFAPKPVIVEEVVELETCPPSVELIAACESGDAKRAHSVLRSLCKAFGGAEQQTAGGSDDEEDAVTTELEVPAAVALDSALLQRWDLRTILNTPDSLQTLSTPLHIAAVKGLSKVVTTLLANGADPCAQDVRSRPPYFLAGDKETRDAFRRYRGQVGEQAADWAAAGVAAALTEDAERERKNKEKEKKKRAAQRKKDQKAADEQAAAEAKAAMERQQQQEAQAALRRQTEAGKCGHCGSSLLGVKALDVYDRRCCSAKCVVALRRTLMAEAADKRLQK